jgi:AcrR family transcriptional regulator
VDVRTRLTTEARRAQLLAIGAELFARRPYPEVSIDEVAEIADISGGLLYHYFPSKRAFFVAIVEDESAKLLQASTPDPSLPLPDQLNAGLEVYIDYAQRHPDGFRMAHQAAVTDTDLRHIQEVRSIAQRDRILTALGATTAVDAVDFEEVKIGEAKIAVTGWLAFTQTAILDWLENPAIGREQLRDLCARALWAAVGVHPLSLSVRRASHDVTGV